MRLGGRAPYGERLGPRTGRHVESRLFLQREHNGRAGRDSADYVSWNGARAHRKQHVLVDGTQCVRLIGVFDSNQEMSECCGCLLTPDGLVTLSVDNDLTSNPLTGKKLQTGAVKILSVRPVNNTCPLTGQGETGAITPAVRAWMTHIQNSNFAITETASQNATLSTAEANRLGLECASIVVVGSGSGICTCGTGE